MTKKNTNRYGLSRHIPKNIQRAVRKKCGFGCVICANGISEYEHFNPPFKDCKDHSEEGITFLCGQCHSKKKRKFLSPALVSAANDRPKALRKACWEDFKLGPQYPTVLIGNNEVFNCQNIIIIENKNILKIDPPEAPEMPFTLSGIFFDEKGLEILKINKNEWSGNKEVWDFETIGGKIIIKTKRENVTTVLNISSEKLPERLIISSLNMYYKGHRFIVHEGAFTYTSPKGGSFTQQQCKSSSDILHKSYMIKISKDGQFNFLGIDN